MGTWSGNKVEVAEFFEVSTNTVDDWIRKGCPFVERGSTDEKSMVSIGCVILGVSEMDKSPSMIPSSCTGAGQLFPKQISGTCPIAKGCH